jgi:hypothetical protein
MKMYCPECAAQNIGDVKFCRACGRDLEIVALSLTNKLPVNTYWLEKQSESLRKVVTGSILLGAALLIGIVPALLISPLFPWLMLWTIFFGWMAAWGIVSTASGIGGMSKSKMMLRHTEQITDGKTPPQLHSVDYRPPMLDKTTTSKLSSPTSITEHTTELLDKHQADI